MEQVRELLKRVRVAAAVEKRAFEYCRLAEVKCSSHSLTPSCLAMVCIELACVQLGEPLDKVQLTVKWLSTHVSNFIHHNIILCIRNKPSDYQECSRNSTLVPTN